MHMGVGGGVGVGRQGDRVKQDNVHIKVCSF